MDDLLKPEPMATYKGPRSWRELIAYMGGQREHARRMIGVRWDAMDAGQQVTLLRASRMESGALVGRQWAALTLAEQRAVVEAANRCRRAADELLGRA